MSLPAATQFSPSDDVRIRALIKALASGIIVPIEFAERVYKIGNEACHRAMESFEGSPAEEPLDLSAMEKLTIARALTKCKGDKLEAARILGIGKTTLYRKIAAYGIEPQPVVICPACGCEIRQPRFPKRATEGSGSSSATPRGIIDQEMSA